MIFGYQAHSRQFLLHHLQEVFAFLALTQVLLMSRNRLLLFIVIDTITISLLSFVSRCSHFEM